MLMSHLLDSEHKSVDYKIMMLGHSKGYKLASAPIGDSDQPLCIWQSDLSLRLALTG